VDVADDPIDIARQSVETLRDRRVLQFDPARAQRLTVTTPDTSAVIIRAGERWALPNPALGTVDPERAADFIRSLRALRFVRLSEDRDADPRHQPSFELEVYGAGDTILDRVWCAPVPGHADLYYAWSQSLAAVCEIDATTLAAIIDQLAHLRRR
jgi:hypothetical protein